MQAYPKWFVCFGTLLGILRDKNFNVKSDFDIGVIGNINNIEDSFHHCSVHHKVVSDVTGNTINIAMRDKRNLVTYDFFRWVKHNGMYFHSYDVNMEFPTNGVLKEYTWKGIPAECFEPRADRINLWKKDLKFMQSITGGGWKTPIPEFPQEGIEVVLPFNYGSCLDYWYPNWHKKDETFGVSRAHKTITVKTCKGIV